MNEDAKQPPLLSFDLWHFLKFFGFFQEHIPQTIGDELRRCISTLRLLRPMVVDLRLHLEIPKSSSNHPWVWHALIVCEELEDCTFQPFLLPLSFVHNWPHWHPFFARCRSVKWGISPEKNTPAVRWFVWLGQVCPMMSWASFANPRWFQTSHPRFFGRRVC